MSAINCLEPAELITLADDAVEDQQVGPNWLTRTFFPRQQFSPNGKFRMMKLDKFAGSVGLHVCHPCEKAPGTDRREMRLIREFNIPHLKYQDHINWCNDQPVKYISGPVPWEKMTHGQKWEQFDQEKLEDQLMGHFTTLDLHASNAIKLAAISVKWANPDEAGEAAGEDGSLAKDIVYPRNANQNIDLNAKGSKFKTWGPSITMKTLGVQNAKLAERVLVSSGAAVTDIVLGPGTYTYGIQDAENSEKHFRDCDASCEPAADGNLTFTMRSIKEGELVSHGQWNGINYWTFSGQYADRKGNLNYHIDPGHALFVANGSNGFQGYQVNGGIDHPEVYEENLAYFIKQYGEDNEGMTKGQSFWSRAIVYPGKPNATLYAKVLSQGLIDEIKSNSDDLLADAA